MSTIVIISPKKPPQQANRVATFNAEHIEGARVSDILREVANQMDQAEEESENE